MVGESAQALVVTHNAVMAAAAAHQIMIEKHEEAGRTVVSAHNLSDKMCIRDRRIVANLSFRPVRILCVYDWCPTSQMILSVGVSKT